MKLPAATLNPCIPYHCKTHMPWPCPGKRRATNNNLLMASGSNPWLGFKPRASCKASLQFSSAAQRPPQWDESWTCPKCSKGLRFGPTVRSVGLCLPRRFSTPVLYIPFVSPEQEASRRQGKDKQGRGHGILSRADCVYTPVKGLGCWGSTCCNTFASRCLMRSAVTVQVLELC